MRREVEADDGAGRDVELVLEGVGGLAHPVAEDAGGQLDALAAGRAVGVVVGRDPRLRGVGAEHLLEDVGGSGHGQQGRRRPPDSVCRP